MVGSVDAPEPGFRPGALGVLARWGSGTRRGLWRALAGSGMRWGPGARRRALEHAGGSGARRGAAFPGD